MTTQNPASPKTVDEYLSLWPDSIREKLDILRKTIKAALPEGAEELISYQMPGYKYHRIVVWFAAFTNHISLFARPAILQAFKDPLNAYKTTKSAIHFPPDKPVPTRLVTDIVQYAVRTNLEKILLCRQVSRE